MALTLEEKKKLEEVLQRTGAHREAGAAVREIPTEYKNYKNLVEQKEMLLYVLEAEVPVRCVVTTAKEKQENCPVYVNMHGGGFIFLQDEDDDLFCAYVASQIQGIVVDIDYASSRDYPYPMAFDQSYGVVHWVFEHCREWGANPAKISMGGHSAGGCLTAAIAMKAARTGDFKVCLQILDYAALDNYAPFEEGGAERSRAFSAYYVDGELDKLRDPYVSPIFASADMMIGLPRTLIINAQRCPFCIRNEDYGKRLAAAGNEVVIKRFLNSRHGFSIRMLDEWKEAQELIVREIINATSKVDCMTNKN